MIKKQGYIITCELRLPAHSDKVDFSRGKKQYMLLNFPNKGSVFLFGLLSACRYDNGIQTVVSEQS